MNKRQWNTLVANGVLSMAQLFELIDHSYDLIVNSLPKKKRAEAGL
jgi:predicted DNA-binding protein (MmcQ/YjbR family)